MLAANPVQMGPAAFTTGEIPLRTPFEPPGPPSGTPSSLRCLKNGKFEEDETADDLALIVFEHLPKIEHDPLGVGKPLFGVLKGELSYHFGRNPEYRIIYFIDPVRGKPRPSGRGRIAPMR